MPMRATHTTPRRLQAPSRRVILAVALVVGSNSATSGQGSKPSSLPGPVTVAERSGGPGASPTIAASLEGLPIVVSEVTVKPRVPPSPAARVLLRVQELATAGVRYRWIQSEGPPVAIEDAARSSIEVTIPAGAPRIGFHLVATGRDRVRIIRVTVPIEDPASAGAPDAAGEQKAAIEPSAVGVSVIRADAGDDQLGVIGHRVTPSARTTLTTTPARATAPAPASLPATEQVLGMALPRLAAGPAVASQVADVFEAIAGRADLYTSFAELQDELRRRLDVVIPADPLQRQAWVSSVFQPLTVSTTSQLAAAGLDLHSPQTLSRPFTPEQRQGVRSHFLMLARGFRAVPVAQWAGR